MSDLHNSMSFPPSENSRFASTWWLATAMPAVTTRARAVSASMLWMSQAAVLIGAVVVVFGNVLNHQFLPPHDYVTFVENPSFNPVSWEHFADFWRSAPGSPYTPVADSW